MILGAIITVFKYVALFVINILPEFPDMGVMVTTSLQPIIEVFYNAGRFIDVRVVGSCLVAVIVFANIEFVWSIIMWIVRKIPGVN